MVHELGGFAIKIHFYVGFPKAGFRDQLSILLKILSLGCRYPLENNHEQA